MARDNTTSLRLTDDLNEFMLNFAVKDRRSKSTLMAIVIEEFAIEHGFEEWLKERESNLPAMSSKKKML
jgi:predicted DNA-binding protein